MKEVVEALKSLREKEWRVLSVIEIGMARHEYVPLEFIARAARLTQDEVEIILRKLHKLGLIQRNVGPYVGYILVSRGYDALALRALVKRGVLESISADPIKVGKESDVYEGRTTSGEVVAVKFHRIGRTSFRQTRRLRTYVGDRRHISWLYESRLSATREYEALNLLYRYGVNVPRPIAHNRHVVVMELLEGVMLSEVPELDDPEETLYKILDEVRKAYKDAQIVHGDLSEFNVLVVDRGKKVYLIDWPQWVSVIHPSAKYLLRRDVENLAKFFRRKYNLKVNPEELVKYVEEGG